MHQMAVIMRLVRLVGHHIKKKKIQRGRKGSQRRRPNLMAIHTVLTQTVHIVPFRGISVTRKVGSGGKSFQSAVTELHPNRRPMPLSEILSL